MLNPQQKRFRQEMKKMNRHPQMRHRMNHPYESSPSQKGKNGSLLGKLAVGVIGFVILVGAFQSLIRPALPNQSTRFPTIGFQAFGLDDIKGEKFAAYLEKEKANRPQIESIITDVHASFGNAALYRDTSAQSQYLQTLTIYQQTVTDMINQMSRVKVPKELQTYQEQTMKMYQLINQTISYRIQLLKTNNRSIMPQVQANSHEINRIQQHRHLELIRVLQNEGIEYEIDKDGTVWFEYQSTTP